MAPPDTAPSSQASVGNASGPVYRPRGHYNLVAKPDPAAQLTVLFFSQYESPLGNVPIGDLTGPSGLRAGTWRTQMALGPLPGSLHSG